jgi:hypothetical protein
MDHHNVHTIVDWATPNSRQWAKAWSGK